MAEDEGSNEAVDSTSIANELIEFANTRLEAGVDAEAIAEALRHASANFTAFAYRATVDPLDTEGITAEFVHFLQYYDDHHRRAVRSPTPLERLVQQVEDE